MHVENPKSILLAAALTGLSACAPLPIHTTVDTLTSETSQRSSDHFDFSSFISLSGLVPQHGAQMLFHQPAFYDRQPNSPSYSIGVSPSRTFVTERKYPMKPSATADADTENAAAILAIKESLEKARLLSVQLATLVVQAEVAARLLETAAEVKPDEATARSLKELLVSDVIDQEGKIDQDKAKAALKVLQTRQIPLKERISAELAAAKTGASRSNVFITRWAKERRSALNTYLSEAFAFSGHGHEARSGILIFGDIRTATLHTGDDLIELLKHADQGMLPFIKETGITTFTIQAKHMAYVADLDMQKSIAAQLSLTKDQLESLSKTFKELDLRFSTSFGVNMDISNSAFVSASEVSTQVRCFFPAPLYMQSVQSEIMATNRYQTVYSVRAQIKPPLIDAAKRVETHLSKTCKQPASQACQDTLKTWLQSCKVRIDAPASDTTVPVAQIALTGGVIQMFEDTKYWPAAAAEGNRNVGGTPPAPLASPQTGAQGNPATEKPPVSDKPSN
jgi:hypothetical protein